jgi:DNA-binding PadR family transcriptional regulator
MVDSEIKDFLDNSHANYVRKLSRVITAFYDAKLAEAGLKICYSQLFMLMAVKGYSGIQRRDFCKTTGQMRTTVMRNMKLLQKSGFVNILKEEEGRKTYLIGKCYSLTELGEQAVEIGYKIWKEFQEKIDNEVFSAGYADQEDLTSLKHTCNEITFALQAM